MKPGTRALGVAESFGDGPRSTLGGAVIRADGRTEAFEFGTCAVGGTDSTDAVADLWTRLDRPDVQWLLLAGIAPAWYNVLDLRALHDQVGRPVLAVTFEERAEPLVAALERATATPDSAPGHRGRRPERDAVRPGGRLFGQRRARGGPSVHTRGRSPGTAPGGTGGGAGGRRVPAA
jgi:hypothetical protein